jgi:hypothetical protein
VTNSRAELRNIYCRVTDNPEVNPFGDGISPNASEAVLIFDWKGFAKHQEMRRSVLGQR